MRIRHIELNGFKSFMDRTVLELPLGVTAVVGPNGCGKSNIVDAVRWVIGEQSPKHLRGEAMEDVICNGNAAAGPLGMAEVSVLLERDDGDLLRAATEAGQESGGVEALPPELLRASEVLVTRRYFRSGDSEYFLNRVPCRLKDITELFLGTGVGTRAYAIIEQGRIEQIVNAKPEDLRSFIEEAAGVTRFRHRKLAAERKMERTRENLLRVQDVLGELERQKASLERQARRAEQSQRIKDELRVLDLRVLAARHRQWRTEADELRDRLTLVQGQEEALHDEVRRWQEATSSAHVERATRQDRLRVVEAELTEQRLMAGEARERSAALRLRRQELETRSGDAAQESATLRARWMAVTADAERLAVDLDAAARERADAEREQAALEERRRQSEVAGTRLAAEVEEAKDALVDGVAEEARLRNLADALRLRRDEIDGRRRKLEEENVELGERLRENEQAADALRRRRASLDAEQTRVAAERQGLAREQQDRAEEEARARAVVDSARAASTQTRSRAESLRELHARHEGGARGVASLLSRGLDGAVLLANVLQVPAPLERAVAAALGARLSHVVVGDTATALSAVRWLQSTAGGTATLLPRDSSRRPPAIVPPGRRLLDEIEVAAEHWSLAESLLGQVLLADDLDEALRLWGDTPYGVTVVTRAGEALDALGAVSGGSEPPLEEMLLARARELRELERQLGECERTVAEAVAAHDAAHARVLENDHEIGLRDERLQTLRVEAVAAEKDRERLDEERARIGAQLEVAALEAGGLAGADDQAAKELAAIGERIAVAQTTVTSARARLEACQHSIGRWREEQARLEQDHTRAAVRAAGAGERVRGVELERTRAQESAHELKERAEAAEREGGDARDAAGVAAGEAAEAEGRFRDATAHADELAIERSVLRDLIAKADSALAADDEAERAARARLEQLRDERAALAVAATERRLAMEHLAGQLVERYGLGLEALDEVPVESDDLSEERAARVESLRARLAQLGDVNPEAVTELAEVVERHAFLRTQRDDLERSLEDLRRTIGKLARTSRERFDETFAAANTKLAEVFPKLFPDGTAELRLTAAEGEAEPGVEIVVQPAGKKLQSLSLLSGGEKALTATALVLSLFLIRPTPFCILDEVDAPLDEANIGRFNQLVREMAESTQFVLITHNRRTMEVADTLYGITMEQPGVSKVVSVRLRQAA